MKKGKFFCSLLLTLTLAGSVFTVPAAAEEGSGETETESANGFYEEEIQSNQIVGWPQGDPVSADAAILMDANTGAILYAKDVEQRLYPASITKIMTTLLALENGNLDDVVTFSEYAVYSIEFGSSHLGMTEGEQLTLEQCLYGIMLASANEVSNAAAEHVAGNISNFLEMMNNRAAELGCTNTHFMNVHGLHDENHYVCARDMALIMQAALKIDKFREIIGTVEYHYPKTNLVDEERYFVNHHKMVSEEDMHYDGIIGGKNGYTDDAWNTLVTAAQRDGLTLISVVLHVPGQELTYEDTRKLLDYGFANFSSTQVTNENTPDMEIVGVEDAAELENIRKADILKKPFSMVGSTQITLPTGVDVSELKKTMDFTTHMLSYSYEGQVLGSVPFTYTGEWETEAQTQTPSEAESAVSAQTENSDQKEGTFLAAVQNIVYKIGNIMADIYGRMDAFIEENTMVAAIIGAILLVIFIPLLLVAVTRHRKYTRILRLREEDMRVQKELENEIERKSAAQVEAELRARALTEELEQERKKNRRQNLSQTEPAEEIPPAEPEPPQALTEPEAAEPEPEEEYIEVPVEEDQTTAR